jgi:Ca2+ transporting ATPase
VLEFTRHRKSMSVLVTEGNKNLLLVKGAPESILDRSTRILLNNGKVEDLTPATKDQLRKKLTEYGTGQHTLRCLGFAYVESQPKEKLNLVDTVKFEEYEK